MNGIALLAIVDPTRFTGYGRTQVTSLLVVLALVSVMMWALVLVSIIVRQAALLRMWLLRRRLWASHRRRQVNHGH